MTYKVDQKVKVTGGKHKGQWGYVQREMSQFIKIRLQTYEKAIARGDSEDHIVEAMGRAKKCHVEAIPEMIWEMPDEKQLCDAHVEFADHHPENLEVDTIVDTVVNEIKEALVHPVDDSDVLSEHGDAPDVDLGAVLPEIDEEMRLKTIVSSQEATIKELNMEVGCRSAKNEELTEALDLYVKLCDFIKHRFHAELSK